MAIDNFRGSQEVTRAAHTPHVRDIGRLMYLELKDEQWRKFPWLFRVFLGDEILPSYVGIIS